MIRQDVLKRFEENRRDKGSPFNEQSFIDWLVPESKQTGGIHNSFEGKRRFYSFWHQVQLDHGVCFSLKDQEKAYTLDGFVSRIEELKLNPKRSKAALRHQMKYGFEWNISVSMNLPLLAMIVYTRQWPVVAVLIVFFVLYANYKHISYHFRQKRYEKLLWSSLEAP